MDVVKFLVEKGANVHLANNNDVTPLWTASHVSFFFLKKKRTYNSLMQEGHLKVVKFLFEKGAKVDRANNEGVTPLSIASQVCLFCCCCRVNMSFSHVMLSSGGPFESC